MSAYRSRFRRVIEATQVLEVVLVEGEGVWPEDSLKDEEHDLARLVNALFISQSTARNRLHTARNKRLLTSSGRGRARGRPTPEATRLLENAAIQWTSAEELLRVLMESEA